MKLKPIPALLLAAGLSCGVAAQSSAAPPQSDASQPTSSADRDTAKKIRKAIVDDKSLSTYAHNVKILARDGQVTLRGPVRSEAEKQAIADKATEVAGAGNVTNELSVEPSK
jgi:hyperosmotically inducible protein